MRSHNRPVIRCPRKRLVQQNSELKEIRHTSVIPEGEPTQTLLKASVSAQYATGHRTNEATIYWHHYLEL
jgi:hypothetical protein